MQLLVLGEAGKQVTNHKLKGEHALAAEMLNPIARQVALIAEHRSMHRTAAVATSVARVRRIYCFGRSSSHAIARRREICVCRWDCWHEERRYCKGL